MHSCTAEYKLLASRDVFVIKKWGINPHDNLTEPHRMTPDPAVIFSAFLMIKAPHYVTCQMGRWLRMHTFIYTSKGVVLFHEFMV